MQISILSDKDLTKEQNRKFCNKIYALENVDINALGLYTLNFLKNHQVKIIINLKYQKSFETVFC